MARQTFTDRPYQSFQANVAADLVGKEGYAVEIVAGTNKIQLYTAGAAPLLGFLQERLEGSDDWNVRLVGKGGTVRAVAGGAINTPAYVKAAAGGKVVAAAQGNLSCGSKLSPVDACADGDVIEIHDFLADMP